MKRTKRGPVIKPKLAPILLTTQDIAQLCSVENNTVITWGLRGKLQIRTKNMWDNFWNLVEFLETKGLRPEGNKDQKAQVPEQREEKSKS